MKKFIKANDLSRDDILGMKKMRQIVPRISGIYFLIKDNEIVYVGKSGHIFNRIYSHEKEKKFDSYSYIECTENLDLLETHFYLKFSPKQNQSFPINKHFLSLTAIKKKFKTTILELRRYIKQKNIKPVATNHYRITDFKHFRKFQSNRQDANLPTSIN